MTNKTSDLKSFNYLENGEIQFSNFDTIKTTKELDAGIYRLKWKDHPEYRVELQQHPFTEKPKIFSFPDRKKIENSLNMFFDPNTNKKFKEFGFNRKVGMLLYGLEGTGKSSIIKYYVDGLVNDHGAICFYVYEQFGIANIWTFIQKVRDIQNSPIVVIFDEIDQLIKGQQNLEGWFKNILDGQLSIDNCIIFGSTNYLENIPAAIKDRPSRFKYCLNIEGIQSSDEIYGIIQPMLIGLLEEEEIKSIAKHLEGSSIDVIKQTCMDKWMDLKNEYKVKKKIGF